MQNMLTPWTQNKSGEILHTYTVAGTIQLIMLRLSFSVYIKVFFCSVERVSI